MSHRPSKLVVVIYIAYVRKDGGGAGVAVDAVAQSEIATADHTVLRLAQSIAMNECGISKHY